MNLPIGALGAAILLWGWQTSWLIPAVLCAVFIESSRFVRWRWEISVTHFNRFSDFSAVALLAIIVGAFLTKSAQPPPFVLVTMMPLALFPLLAAQCYSTLGGIPLSSLFWTYRRRLNEKGIVDDVPKTLDVKLPYCGLCILSASIASTRSVLFYPLLVCLMCWLMFPLRSTRSLRLVWLLTMIIIAAAGMGVQRGLQQLQRTFDARAVDWMSRNDQKYRDGLQNTITSIGSLAAESALSDRIVFRMKTDQTLRDGLLLQEASFNEYMLLEIRDQYREDNQYPLSGASSWIARKYRFDTLSPTFDGATWIFGKPSAPHRTVTIMDTLHNGAGSLKMPNGTFQIKNFPGFEIRRNQFGATEVKGFPKFIRYDCDFTDAASWDSLPDANDLVIPKRISGVIGQAFTALQLEGQTPDKVMTALRARFRRDFTYSLSPSQPPVGLSQMEHFLHNSRAGHCELFATATVLLLRAAGIPSRYAVGYLAHEFSNLEDCYIIRERDAHAWALAWVNDRWVTCDATPPSWIGFGMHESSISRTLADLFAWLRFSFSMWWNNTSNMKLLLSILAIILLFILFKSRRRLSAATLPTLKKLLPARNKHSLQSGSDSPFFLIEQLLLKKQGMNRNSWETYKSYLTRLQKTESDDMDSQTLQTLLNLHYRFRFDPHGLSEKEFNHFDQTVQSWLQKNL